MTEEHENNLGPTGDENRAAEEEHHQEQDNNLALEDGSGIDQEKVNKRINKITFEKHEEIRKREAVEEENRKLKEQIEKDKQAAADAEVQVPDMPDAFDPEFSRKVKERDEAIRKRALADANRKAAEDSRRKSLETTANEQALSIQQNVDRMYADGKKLGIKDEDLKKADKTLTTFIRSSSLAQFILAQEQSAQLVTHLADNIVELDKISKMDPLSASAYISSKIIPGLKKGVRSSGAPDPLDTLPTGKGDKSSDPYLKGVQFE